MPARRPSSSERITFAFALCLSVVGLWLAFRGVDWNGTVATIRGLRPGPIALVVAPLALGTIARAFRWHLLMRGVGSTPAASAEAIFVSAFFSGLLPFRAGEVARVVYFNRRTGAPLTAAAAALLVERVLDVATLALFALVLLPSRTQLPELAFSPWGLGGVIAAATAVMAAAAWWTRRPRRAEGSGAAHRGWARARDQARAALSFLASPRETAGVALLSVTSWLLSAIPVVLVFRAAGVHLPFESGMVVLLAVTLAIALPSTPGFLGTFHAGFVLGAQLVGVPRVVAAPVALITHLLFQIPFILAGAIVLTTAGSRGLTRSAGAKPLSLSGGAGGS